MDSSVHPRVVVSVGSRFHAFDLARELADRDCCTGSYTGYPHYSHRRFGLPAERMRSLPWYELLNRGYLKAVHLGLARRGYDHIFAGWFDRHVASLLGSGANVFVGFSSMCQQSLRRAKELGMVTVVERGSSHILWQRDILIEESERIGIAAEFPSPKTVERELEEYARADYIAVPSDFAVRTFLHHGRKRLQVAGKPVWREFIRFQTIAAQRIKFGRTIADYSRWSRLGTERRASLGRRGRKGAAMCMLHLWVELIAAWRKLSIDPL